MKRDDPSEMFHICWHLFFTFDVVVPTLTLAFRP